MYPEQDSMSRGLQLYLESPHSNEIKFCVILHNNLGVQEANWQRERERLVKMFKAPRYQTVLDGRPLVYLFQSNLERFKELREAVAKEGINDETAKDKTLHERVRKARNELRQAEFPYEIETVRGKGCRLASRSQEQEVALPGGSNVPRRVTKSDIYTPVNQFGRRVTPVSYVR